LLLSRYEETGDFADLDAAIAAHSRAIKLTPLGHVDRGGRVMNRAIALTLRATAAVDPQEYAAAISSAHQAIALIPPLHPGAARAHATLAEAFEACYRCTNDSDDARAAARAYRQALDTSLTVGTRIDAGRGLGRIAAEIEDFDSALVGYAAAVASMDLAASRSIPRKDQERMLAELSGTPQDAAAMAIETGDLFRALELLEQGRGLLLTRAVHGARTEDRILQVRPDLANELASIDRVLASVDDPTSLAVTDMGTTLRVEDALMLSQRREQIMIEIHHVPGLETLQHAPDSNEIIAAAGGRTVVVINISQHRCDALLPPMKHHEK
jgi:tetratricopeptide (TPR) repeat protein